MSVFPYLPERLLSLFLKQIDVIVKAGFKKHLVLH